MDTAAHSRESLRSAMFRIYRLADEVEDLYQSTGGEVDWRTEKWQEWLDAANAQTLEALCEFSAERYAAANAARVEADRLKAAAERFVADAEWAEGLMGDVLRKLGVRKAEAGTWKVSLKKGLPRVEQVGAVDISLMDPDLVRVVPAVPAKYEPDKVKIRKAIDAGEVVESFKVVFGDERVVVK